MKRLRDMNNKELEKVNRIILIIALIAEVAVIIENIIWFDDYSLTVILLASLAIACGIYTDINKFDKKKGE